MSTRKLMLAIITTTITALIASSFAFADTPPARTIIWVNDVGVRDTQFGYFDGATALEIGAIFPNADIEGLACLHDQTYAVAGGDGKFVSALYTMAMDADANTATLTQVGDLLTAAGAAFYEVASLAEHPDGSLWGFARRKSLKGIVRIDPATAVTTLIQPSSIDAEGVEWVGDTLYLVSGRTFYRWTPGGAISEAFRLDVPNEIEALDYVDGYLWVGIHKSTANIIAIDPANGQIVPQRTFSGRSDIESLTYCTSPSRAGTPTATTGTPSATISPTVTVTPPGTPSASATPPTTPQTPPAITATPTTGTPSATSSPTVTVTPPGTPSASATPPTTPQTPPAITATPTTALTPDTPTNEPDDDEPGAEIFLPLINR